MDNKQVTAEWIAQQRVVCGNVKRLNLFSLAEADKIFKVDMPAALDALEATQKELSAQRIAFQNLYGNHQRGISPKVIACPVCGGVECVRLTQRTDAPELFGLSCGECGSHATIQLFAEPDALEASMQREAEKDAEISRLKTELSRPESHYLLNKIIDLTADRDAAIKDAALSKCKTCASRENCYLDADCDICIDWKWLGLFASNIDAPTGAGSEVTQ